MEPKNGKNLTDEAYQKIKGFILRSEIYPRQKIILEDLARQMGISRTPIREAMSRLVKEGYVKQILNRGFFVNEITVEEVEQLYGAREALEPYLAEEAARRVTPAQVDELEKLLQEYREYVERRPIRRRRLVDLVFHTKVAEIAGNPYLKRVLDEVFERIVLKQRMAVGQLDRGKDAWVQHRAILVAIRNRNPKMARQEALYHVQISKQLAMLRLHEQAEYLNSLGVVG
ncbi:MAG TPA: GntR family transcriptional regulator [Candidatus Eisenbacteria bacterium]|nr:GntR family transcriptional regulator [Candidatus Eisenbacteria bacterium]